METSHTGHSVRLRLSAFPAAINHLGGHTMAAATNEPHLPFIKLYMYAGSLQSYILEITTCHFGNYCGKKDLLLGFEKTTQDNKSF